MSERSTAAICSTINTEAQQVLQHNLAVSVETTASILGTGRAATYRAVRAGQIPSFRIGGKVLVPTASLRRMLGLETTA
jgi:excisionase family DNA binding protein